MADSNVSSNYVQNIPFCCLKHTHNTSCLLRWWEERIAETMVGQYDPETIARKPGIPPIGGATMRSDVRLEG